MIDLGRCAHVYVYHDSFLPSPPLPPNHGHVCVQGDGYKGYYYQSKLGLAPGEEQARRQVAQSYLEGAFY